MNGGTQPAAGERWTRLRRLLLIVRARRLIASLERPLVVRDPFPRWVFAGSMIAYACIGGSIQRRGGFDAFNYFFNADCPRVIEDMAKSHLKGASGFIANAHPLFALLANPPTALLARFLGDGGVLAARIVCHAAAAWAAVLAHSCFVELRAPRWLARAATLCFALSTTELVFGSVVETFSFVPLALTAGVLCALRSTRPVVNAFAQVLALGMNTALLPHSLFAAPVLWFPRLRGPRWLFSTLGFFLSLLVVTVGLAVLQERLYPGAGFFFQKNAARVYDIYWSIPKTKAILLHRASLLVRHIFAFSVVAPVPLLTDPPEKITTFMWEQKQLAAHYEGLGRVVAADWIVLVGSATIANAVGLFRGDGVHRSRIVFLSGWLTGAFGLFMLFGDDLLLFSPFWIFHLLAWVVLGLRRIAEEHSRWAPRLAGAFVLALGATNAVFVTRMLSHYG